MCLELVLGLQLFPQNAMVIDFTIDGQGEGSVLANDRLGASILEGSAIGLRYRHLRGQHTDTDDTQTFMGKDCELLANSQSIDHLDTH